MAARIAAGRIDSMEKAAAVAEYYGARARRDFWSFRKYVRDDLVIGWWLEDVAGELQEFWNEFKAGERPKLIIQAPPQHGKTWTLTDFVAWATGKEPGLKTVFASYSDNLGVKVNSDLQRVYTLPKYRIAFPNMEIVEGGSYAPTGSWKRNSELIQFVGQRGEFRNTTVNGQITGFSLDLGIIDDPLKGHEEANSKLMRDKTWDWIAYNFFSRFSDDAAFILTMTRWHLDDPVGRWLEVFPDTRVLRYAAIGTEDDWTVRDGLRGVGKPLFLEYKSLEFLNERRRMYTQAGWESLYQQNPIIVGSGVFPVEKFKVIPVVPKGEIKRSVRYWDKAATEGGGACTAGVLMHELLNGTFCVESCVSGQWSVENREARIEQTAQIDNKRYPRLQTWVEQEPGSGGKESAEATIRRLRGFRVSADKVTGSKEVRAEPYAAQVQGGNVAIVAGDWNRGFLDEHEQFPAGRRKDQVDASAGAFNKLTTGSRYDTSMLWVTHTDGVRDA